YHLLYGRLVCEKAFKDGLCSNYTGSFETYESQRRIKRVKNTMPVMPERWLIIPVCCCDLKWFSGPEPSHVVYTGTMV
ncbi:MAG: hypothetical protein ACKVKR_04760, partial [Pseudomonadales bacterium]